MNSLPPAESKNYNPSSQYLTFSNEEPIMRPASTSNVQMDQERTNQLIISRFLEKNEKSEWTSISEKEWGARKTRRLWTINDTESILRICNNLDSVTINNLRNNFTYKRLAKAAWLKFNLNSLANGEDTIGYQKLTIKLATEPLKSQLVSVLKPLGIKIDFFVP